MKTTITGHFVGQQFTATFEPAELESLLSIAKINESATQPKLEAFAREILARDDLFLPAVEIIFKGRYSTTKRKNRTAIESVDLQIVAGSIQILAGSQSIEIAKTMREIEPDLSASRKIPIRIIFSSAGSLFDKTVSDAIIQRNNTIKALAQIELKPFVDLRSNYVKSDSKYLLSLADIALLWTFFDNLESAIYATKTTLEYLQLVSPEIRDVMNGSAASEIRQGCFLPHPAVLIALISCASRDTAIIHKILSSVNFRRVIGFDENPLWKNTFLRPDRVDQSRQSIENVRNIFLSVSQSNSKSEP